MCMSTPSAPAPIAPIAPLAPPTPMGLAESATPRSELGLSQLRIKDAAGTVGGSETFGRKAQNAMTIQGRNERVAAADGAVVIDPAKTK